MTHALSQTALEPASASTPSAAALIAAARLLVVDDSRMLRMGILRALRQLGFTHIEEASNGLQALARLREQPFDLMLLDVEMPEMNGMQVLGHMQADPSLRGLPVIVISGGQDTDDAVRCIELGAEDYLPKPFSEVLLRARLTNALEKKKLRDLDRLRLEEIKLQQAKTEEVLLNILPRSISDRIKGGESLIADAHAEVSVLFADLVGFTPLSKRSSATDLVGLLNAIMSGFDLIAQRFGVEKIKTIGDCYMLAGGIPTARPDHAAAVADTGLAMLAFMDRFNAEHGSELRMRIGINSGPAVAGVIGLHKYSYDLWGDAVNVASRMEATGEPGRIHVSDATANLLRPDFALELRGEVQVKGIGLMQGWFVQSRL